MAYVGRTWFHTTEHEGRSITVEWAYHRNEEVWIVEAWDTETEQTVDIQSLPESIEDEIFALDPFPPHDLPD